jgi:putative tryptophan/tyrosine transport system substrate-binding protein
MRRAVGGRFILRCRDGVVPRSARRLCRSPAQSVGNAQSYPPRLSRWHARARLRRGTRLRLRVPETLGNPEGFADLTAELARLPVDVLLVPVCGAPLNAARQASRTIPIVVATCNDDLVETDVIKSMAHPGGNVTGLSKLTPELAPKRLSLLKQTVPSITRVGVLWNPSYSAFTSDWRELREAAEHMGVTLVPFEFRRAEEFEAVFAAIRRERLDAFITFSDVVV